MPSQRAPGLSSIVLVGAGGFVGAGLRHAVTVAFPTAAVGTLAVNVLGSFALGIVLSESHVGRLLSVRARLVLATGLLSSFTTYSTFAVETTALAPGWAVAYVAGNYGLAVLAVVFAQLLARWLS